MIPVDKYILRKKEVAFRMVGEDGIILDLDTGKYYSFNDVGEKIWEFCDGTRNFKDIIREILLEFEVSQEQVASDASAFIERLLEVKLVTLQEERAIINEDW